MTDTTWTPATRPGIVPLHPLGFGTILGRSFTVLRHNPRVLLGFALVVQAVGALLVAGVLVGIGVLSFSRLASLQPGTEEFETVLAGSVALLGIAGLILTVASAALGVIVQGVVVADVLHAVVAEKLTLRRLWGRVRPVAGRLIGYGLLLTLAIVVAVAIVVGIFFGLSVIAGPIGFVVAMVVALAMIPLSLWLTTKLMLVPAVLVAEQATIRTAIARSWTLIRGRFWVGLGVSVIISLAFGALAQVVSVPLSIAALGMGTIVTPTGEPDVAALTTFLVGNVVTQLVVFLIQCVSLIVLSTGAALVYVDCRMRHEGLDLDLLSYVDQRDAGAGALADPYRLHIGRSILPRWGAPPAPWPPPAGAAWPATSPTWPTPGAAGPPPGAWPPAQGAAWPPPSAGPASPTAVDPAWPAPSAGGHAGPVADGGRSTDAASPYGSSTPGSTQWVPPGSGSS